MPSRREPIWTGNFIAVSFVNLFVFLSFQMIFPTLPLYVNLMPLSALSWVFLRPQP